MAATGVLRQADQLVPAGVAFGYRRLPETRVMLPAAPGTAIASVRSRGRSAELFLALHLLLAGFFALLLAFAGPAPERARLVLGSLGVGSPADPQAAQREAAARPDAGPRLPLDRPERIIVGEPLSAADRQRGLLARVEIPADRLFDEAGAIRRWQLFLLGRLARLVGRETTPKRQLEILVPAEQVEDLDRTRRRLQALLATLQKLGAPGDVLSVGVRPGRAALWTVGLRQLAGSEQR